MENRIKSAASWLKEKLLKPIEGFFSNVAARIILGKKGYNEAYQKAVDREYAKELQLQKDKTTDTEQEVNKEKEPAKEKTLEKEEALEKDLPEQVQEVPERELEPLPSNAINPAERDKEWTIESLSGEILQDLDTLEMGTDACYWNGLTLSRMTGITGELTEKREVKIGETFSLKYGTQTIKQLDKEELKEYLNKGTISKGLLKDEHKKELDAMFESMGFKVPEHSFTEKVQPNVSQRREYEKLLSDGSFSKKQKREIRNGMGHGLSPEQIRQYASPERSARQMAKMRRKIEKNLEQNVSERKKNGRQYAVDKLSPEQANAGTRIAAENIDIMEIQNEASQTPEPVPSAETVIGHEERAIDGSYVKDDEIHDEEIADKEALAAEMRNTLDDFLKTEEIHKEYEDFDAVMESAKVEAITNRARESLCREEISEERDMAV